jgi:hypothetical protein
LTFSKYIPNIKKKLLILVIFLPLLIRNLAVMKSLGNNIFSFILISFGGIFVSNTIDVFSVFLTVVPNVLIIYIFSNFMREDFDINYTYVFTRIQKKQTWLYEKSVQLLINVTIIFLLLIILGFFVGIISGLSIQSFNIENLKILLFVWLLNSFSIYCLVIIVNFLSLKFGSTISFISVSAIYLFSLAISILFYNKNPILNILIFFLIPSNQMYIWHTDCIKTVEINKILYSNTLDGFLLLYSFIILIFYIIAIYFVERSILLHQDLIEFIKEE